MKHTVPALAIGLLLSVLTMVLTIYPASVLAADASASATASAAGSEKFTEIPATRELLSQLRSGGFVLYLRHGTTDNTRPDRFPTVDLNDCRTQRPLTEEGRKLATFVGEAIRKARIPIGEIRVSPLCRAKESADAAFPKLYYTVDKDLMYTANLTSQQKRPILDNTRRLLSASVEAGNNRLIVAHAPNLMDLIAYFPKEGTLVIFRPKNGAGFDYIASVPPALWPDLIN